MTTESDLAAVKKELADLREALAEGKPIKIVRPVKIDLKYLCPKDPHYKKIADSNGVVLPDDGPTHLNGWIVDIKNVLKKHRTFNADGKEVEFTSTHQTATWKCQQCGAEKNVDPYP